MLVIVFSRRKTVLLKTVAVNIAEIYLPAERRKELDQEKVDMIAETIMDGTEERPIQVRRGKDRYVLVKGTNRLEARKALGDTTIQAYIVSAKKY